LLSKPIVDGLEKKLADKASFVKLDVWGNLGRALASKYGIRAVPSFLIFDGRGNLIYHQVGIPDQKAIINAIENLEGRD